MLKVVISFSVLISPCLVILKFHPPASHLTTLGLCSRIMFPSGGSWLLSLSEDGVARLSILFQVTWVFTCFSRHEAHISSSHRQQLTASIPTALKSAWPHANLFFLRGQVPPVLCLLMYAANHRPSDVLRSIEYFHLLLGVGYLSLKCHHFKCSFKIFYSLLSYVWNQKVLKT